MFRLCLSVCLCVCLSCLWLYSPCGPWPLFQFHNLYTVGRTPWTGDQPVTGPLPTHRTTQTQNKCTQTSMPWVGYESTIPVFERVKMVHALGRTATVIGIMFRLTIIKSEWRVWCNPSCCAYYGCISSFLSPQLVSSFVLTIHLYSLYSFSTFAFLLMIFKTLI
jgi:hypothetical protein